MAALVPLSQRQRPQRQALLSLRGSGGACWPAPPPSPAVRPGSLLPLESTASLALGSAVAIDATAMISRDPLLLAALPLPAHPPLP